MTAPARVEEFPVDHTFAARHGVEVTEWRVDDESRVCGLGFRRVDKPEPPVATPIRLDPPERVIPRLTARQQDVLALMAEGMSNGEIGVALDISQDTIKSLARLLFRKLGVSDRAAAVAVGFQTGLLS